ncbi:MAG: hypothetical protein GC161_04300 [Planctomycetaceae bacterium]|nr:hypothetical protein [Planctomycetaceae bacterium]
MLRPALLALALPLLPATALAADVFVVDVSGGPGTDFLTIADALSNAQNGDILLVRSGVYEGFASDGKAVTVVADQGANALLSSNVAITQVPTQTVFTLRGFEFAATADLTLTDNQGLVRLEDLDLSNFQVAPGAAIDTTNVRIQTTAAVRMARVTLGYDGPNPVTDPAGGAAAQNQPAPALRAVEGSQVHLLNCQVYGTPGRDAFSDPATLLWVFAEPGGNAIEFDATSPVRLASSTAIGGPGGDGTVSTAFGCVAPREGGNGILAIGGWIHELSLHSSAANGGTGGAMAGTLGPIGCPAEAANGVGVAQVPGALLGAAVSDRLLPGLDIARVIREGENVMATYQGLPGDQAFLLASLQPNAAPSIPLMDYLYLELAGAPVVFPLGMAMGDGTANWMLPAFDDVLAPGTGLVFTIQTLGFRANGSFELGAFATALLADAGA